MNGWAWLLVAYLVVNALGTIYLVGKPRKPITPEVAVGCLLVYVLLITILFAAVGVL